MASYTRIAPAMVAIGVLCFFASSAFATNYPVGDTTGWTLGYDYSTWASGKTFVVGDTLTFKYASGAHTVTKVPSSDYTACSASNSISSDTSGSTTIPLKTAGTHYFICAISGHCSGGMKVAVNVTSSSASGGSAPSTTTPSTSTPFTTTTTTSPTVGTHSYGAAGTVSPTVAVMVGAVVLVKIWIGLF